MSDLRTRIAAVLLGDHCVQAMTGPCEDCRAHALRQADAVIHELRLHVVTVGDFQTVIKGSYPKPLEES